MMCFPPAQSGVFGEVTARQGLMQGLFHQGEAHVTSSLQWDVMCVDGRPWWRGSGCAIFTFSFLVNQGDAENFSIKLRGPIRW